MRTGVAAMTLVTAVAVVTLGPNHPAGRVPSEDAGVFFYSARELLAGGTPYRDVWDHKPPLVYAIDAVGLAVAGPVGVWLLQIVALAAAAWLSLALLRRHVGLLAATIGTVAWLLAAPRLFLTDGQQTSYVELFVIPLQLAALALADGAAPRWRGMLLLGALGAAALLLKPTLVGTWVAIALVMLWSGRRAALVPLAGMIAGGAAVLAAAAIFFASRGALGDLVDQAFRYNLAYASFTPPLSRLGAIPEGLRLLSPSGLALGALAAWLYAVVRRPALPRLVAFVVVALPIEMLLATSGRAYHYYFLPWLPAMGVLAAFASAEVLRHLERRRALAVLAAALVLMSIQPVRLVWRLAMVGDDGSARAAAALVRERTAADDLVLVWGSHTEILVLAERRSPTRFVFQYAPLATRGYANAAAIDALVTDLERRPPALIVDTSRTSFVTPPLDRDGLRAFRSPEPQYSWPAETERVIAFVEAGYTRDGTVPGTEWTVWRRR